MSKKGKFESFENPFRCDMEIVDLWITTYTKFLFRDMKCQHLQVSCYNWHVEKVRDVKPILLNLNYRRFHANSFFVFNLQTKQKSESPIRRQIQFKNRRMLNEDNRTLNKKNSPEKYCSQCLWLQLHIAADNTHE